MIEFKTLKDLAYNILVLDKDTEVVSKELLKAEAVKWVKYYRNHKMNHNTEAKALMIFHNITEEDLK